VGACGTFVLEPRGYLKEGGESAGVDPQAVTRVSTDSPTLLAREREIFDRYAERLIDLIAEERDLRRDDLEPVVIARALISLHRATIDHVRRRILAGASKRPIAQELRTRGGWVFALLKEGLGYRSERARPVGSGPVTRPHRSLRHRARAVRVPSPTPPESPAAARINQPTRR
jgi:hypothetical protein